MKKIAHSDRLNIAVVGLGGMGITNIQAVHGTENIVALCDVDWKYSKPLLDCFPRTRKYRDFRRMFDEAGKDIDAVFVATPDHTHAIIAATAMTLGKHVYVQKPLAHSVYESRLLAKLAAQYKVATQMGNHNSYPFNVQRWDAIRYLILYHIGGLYADMDYECIRPLDVLLSGSTCCMGMEPTVNTKIFNRSLIVGNALMASTPKHPYMAAIIEDMKTNFSVNYGKIDSMQIMETTGPFMVTRVYERFKRKKNITLLPADLISPLTREEVSLLRTGHKLPDLLKKIDKAFAIHYSMVSWTDQIVS